MLEKKLIDFYLKVEFPKLGHYSAAKKEAILEKYTRDIQKLLRDDYEYVEVSVEQEFEYTCPYCSYTYRDPISSERSCCNAMIDADAAGHQFVVAIDDLMKPRILTVFSDRLTAEDFVKDSGGYPVYLTTGREVKGLEMSAVFIKECGKCRMPLTIDEVGENHKYKGKSSHERCCEECHED
jgi:hypothetical protein